MTSGEDAYDDRPARWELWRQDDNGNRFLIGRFDTSEAAEVEQHRFEALGHKQTYWVQAAAPEGGTCSA